jgi:hypothetical protein
MTLFNFICKKESSHPINTFQSLVLIIYLGSFYETEQNARIQCNFTSFSFHHLCRCSNTLAVPRARGREGTGLTGTGAAAVVRGHGLGQLHVAEERVNHLPPVPHADA